MAGDQEDVGEKPKDDKDAHSESSVIISKGSNSTPQTTQATTNSIKKVSNDGSESHELLSSTVTKGLEQMNMCGDSIQHVNLEDDLQMAGKRPPKSSKKNKTYEFPTNLFEILTVENKSKLMHYIMLTKPTVPGFLARIVADSLISSDILAGKSFAYDGTFNFYIPVSQQLPKHEISTTFYFDEEQCLEKKSYTVSLHFLNEVDLTTIQEYTDGKLAQPPLAAINLLKAACTSQIYNYPRIGECYFDPVKSTRAKLGGGLELKHGLHILPVIGSKLYLLISDVYQPALPQDNVGLIMYKILNLSPTSTKVLTDDQKRKLATNLVTTKVIYKGPNRETKRGVWAIAGICGTPEELMQSEGSGTSISEYYKEEYNYEIKHPLLVCILIEKDGLTEPVPPEFCEIFSIQAPNCPLNAHQKKSLISNSHNTLQFKEGNILKMMNSCNLNTPAFSFARGILNGYKRVNAKGHTLSPPDVICGAKKTPTVKGWSCSKFHQCVTIERWCIVCIVENLPSLTIKKLSDYLLEVGASLGMTLLPPSIFEHLDNNEKPLNERITHFFNEVKDQGYTFVLAIISATGNDYDIVKEAGDISCGIITQCMTDATLSRINPTVVSNLLYKINVRLNGITHILDKSAWPEVLKHPAMFMGGMIEFSKNSSSTEMMPMAVVVSSYESNYALYRMSCRRQSSTAVFELLPKTIFEHLSAYYEANSALPKHIVFYRFGVNEEIHQEILNEEVRGVLSGCQTYKEGYQPIITFICVDDSTSITCFPPENDKKRHEKDPKRRESRQKGTQSLPQGLVIDEDIVRPHQTSFFFCPSPSSTGSHNLIEYNLLWDNSGMAIDELQRITYNLCHLVQTSSKAHQFPAPIYCSKQAVSRIKSLSSRFWSHSEASSEFEPSIALNKEYTSKYPMFYL